MSNPVVSRRVFARRLDGPAETAVCRWKRSLEFLVAENNGSQNYGKEAQSHRACGAARSRKINPALREWLDLLIPTMVQQYVATAGERENSGLTDTQEFV
jgi:hypothetical protein